jgi:hypothetical protein
MPKFVPAFDIWTIPQEARAAIPRGQWVYAGDPANLGRFYGATDAQTVVAWLGNARGHKRALGGIPGYFRTIKRYAIAAKNNAQRRKKI